MPPTTPVRIEEGGIVTADGEVWVLTIPGTPVGAHGQITDLSTVQTVSAPPGADGVVLFETGGVAINVTVDGQTNPTTSKGLVVPANDFLSIALDISEFRAIASDGAATATLDYQWFSLR